MRAKSLERTYRVECVLYVLAEDASQAYDTVNEILRPAMAQYDPENNALVEHAVGPAVAGFICAPKKPV